MATLWLLLWLLLRRTVRRLGCATLRHLLHHHVLVVRGVAVCVLLLCPTRLRVLHGGVLLSQVRHVRSVLLLRLLLVCTGCLLLPLLCRWAHVPAKRRVG